MIIVYFEPFKTRNIEAIDINWFYKAIDNFKDRDVLFITGDDYFKPVDHFTKTKNFLSASRIKLTEKYYDYSLPSDALLAIAHKEIIPQQILDKLFINENNDIEKIEKCLITEEVDEYKEYFKHIIRKQLSLGKTIECIFLIKNCPSIESIAKEYNIPTIHYEIGAFRNPSYINTAYFDFKGVNGNTECKERYNNFKMELETSPVEILSKKQILNLLKIKEERNFKLILKKAIKKLLIKRYKLGIAGQVYNDSNIVAFSNGYNSESLIKLAFKHFNPNDIIIRNHPGNPKEKQYKYKNIDKSSSSYEFINRCNSILTINSSVGLEAILLNKEAFIVGDSPFNFLSADIQSKQNIINKTEELLRLNFVIFGYLIPLKLLFDQQYLQWRLNMPSNVEIYNKHLEYYKKLKEQKND